MGMPALMYRWYFGAYGVRGFELTANGGFLPCTFILRLVRSTIASNTGLSEVPRTAFCRDHGNDDLAIVIAAVGCRSAGEARIGGLHDALSTLHCSTRSPGRTTASAESVPNRKPVR